MKDPILEHTAKMIRLHFKMRQKHHAQSTQTRRKTEDGGSYIPDSMQPVNLALMPDYLKDNKKLETIVERSRVEHDASKE